MENTQTEDYTHKLVRSPSGMSIAARQSGLYKSEDQGETWVSMYGSLNLDAPLPTMTVAISTEFEQDGRIFAGVTGGVLISQDRGGEWMFSKFPEPVPLVTAIEVSPNFSQDKIVLAGTLEDGVFLSHDRGHTWQAWNFGLLDWNVLALAISPDFSRDRTVFIGTETGIAVSTNGGRGWRNLPFPTESAPVLSITLPAGFSDSGLIEVETEQMGNYRSCDRGETWAAMEN